jgi:hypothetical protein
MRGANQLELLQLETLTDEAKFCQFIIDKIDHVKIFAVVNHSDRERKYTIELCEHFSNFPFDWKKEIQILLADAVTQYFETIKTQTK